MEDGDIGSAPGTHTEPPNKSSWSRIIAKVKRQLSESKARKEERKNQESPADRAANVTASATKAIAWLTGALFLVAVVQAIQIYEGGRDTSAIAGAAQTEACAAKRNADAAQGFASTAVLINGNISDAVLKLKVEGEAIEKSRETSDADAQRAIQASVDNARSDQRAYIVAIPKRYDVRMNCEYSVYTNCVDFQYQNVGRTPAVDVKVTAIFDPDPIGPEAFAKMRVRKYSGLEGSVLAIGSPESATAENPDPQRTRGRCVTHNGSVCGYSIYGLIQYKDIFDKPRETGFCIFVPNMADAHFCQFGNWFDKRPKGYIVEY